MTSLGEFFVDDSVDNGVSVSEGILQISHSLKARLCYLRADIADLMLVL